MSEKSSAPSPDSPPPPSPEGPPPSSSSSSSSSSSPPPESTPSSDSSDSAPPPEDNSSSSPPPPSNDNNNSNKSGSGSPSKSNPSSPIPPSSNSSSPSTPGGTAIAPPTPSSSKKTPSPSSSSDDVAVIVGVSVGVTLFVILLVGICIACCVKKKKRRRTHDDMHFYADPDAKHKPNKNNGNYGGEYYQNSHQHWQGGNTPSNHMGSMGPMPGGQWPAPPPPPPMMSSEMSSNYSGPRQNHPLPPPSPGLSVGFNSSSFTYDELAAATRGFAQENLLGQGGFGYVHKGVLPHGKEVAVKSLKSGSGQGEREFQAEVEIISRVHHRHLVSLVGYCIAGGQRMLVYEFVPNNTLEYHLHGKGRPVMDWETRLRIATGSAKGLAYLHEDCHPRIIHRDIKAANILIDYNFEAMVADFGLAKLSSDNNTHVSTRVMGTFGYLAPEYASSGKLTEKSDVFSFGVMLLELITGRRPVDNNNIMEDSLVDWVRPLVSSALETRNFSDLVDPRMEGNYNQQEMARMVACAGASIKHSARKRPKMSQIVRALEGDVSLEALNESSKPPTSGNNSAYTSSDYDTAMYNADMEKFRKVALSSQEFSGDFGGQSSGDSSRSPHKL